jgi:Leucine-rich repeat (LRR) protein
VVVENPFYALKSLVLSGNKLENLSELFLLGHKIFPSLRKLDLSNNSISELITNLSLEQKIFLPPSLEILNVSRNKLGGF